MPPIPGLVHWHHYLARNVKTIKEALSRAARTLDGSLSQPQAKLEPVLVRNSPKQPINPLARIRQNQTRWYSSVRHVVDGGVRTFTTNVRGKASVRYERASLPKSRVSSYLSQSSGRAPFAHTLRPNLTGGTLGRTSGGYSLGSGRLGGQRAFSHAPAAQAQVVSNVSQAVRAFIIGGQKAQFDGVSPRGEKRYEAVSALQEDTSRKIRSVPRATPGSFVDFRLNPTVTALATRGSVTGFPDSDPASPIENLNTEGLLDVLSADFSRALKDLAATLNDLRRLSSLGDLPITYEDQHLRVHFSGCDAGTVERLCEELNVTRGLVYQDPTFDDFAGTNIALLFPFAPSAEPSDADSLYDAPAAKLPSQRQYIDVKSLLTVSEDNYDFAYAYSTQSAQSDSDLDHELAGNPWLSSPSGFETVHSGSRSAGSGNGSDKYSPLEYQGFEGIYRFIEELDAVKK